MSIGPARAFFATPSLSSAFAFWPVSVSRRQTTLSFESIYTSNDVIKREVERRWPGTLVVGEESVAADPSLLDRLAGAEVAITVDPVDGTANFAAGLPLFAVMASVVVRGETVAGIIHDPVLGDTVTAIRGAGAFLTRRDGQSTKLKVAEPASLNQMVGGLSWSHMDEPDRARICANMAKIRMTFAFNCSAYEYWMVASGKLHFIGHAKLMPWDHLAGVLIAQEAGGYAARLDGGPYLPSHVDGGLLVAVDRDSWELLRRDVFVF
jgi:myo-inositol-1(or 4)-monophosphatase